ncbi:MAG: tetratricopeptide repeat protein [Magnetococcales bacterium]|nr:tetratricopeptide repeat protein [Magnetococcales bacterium]
MNGSPSLSALLSQAMEAYRRGEHTQVTSLVRQALALDPENADALYLLGISAAAMSRPDLAANLLTKAIARHPGQPYYHLNLAAAQSDLGQPAKAEESLRTALALRPELAEAHVNLGNLRMDQGNLSGAIDCYLQALRINPELVTGYYNLGVILQEFDDHAGALEQFAQALRRDPENALAHMGRAASLLKTGRMREGWEAYAWRFRLPNNTPRLCPAPRWDGASPAGQRLYVYTEQGFGDALMFARFAPTLKEMGATVLLECRPELVRLLAASDLADQVTGRSLDDPTPPPFDYDRHIPLMCLPRLLGTTLENLSPRHPYLMPDPARVRAWGERLGAVPGLRVGLSWSGNPQARVNRDRACTLRDLLPLTSLPGIQFFSLQKGPPATQLTEEIRQRHAITPLDAELTDFAETAAALQHIDLLISTDTAIVHLAGGVGRPVWTLLHTACEWRWLQSRSDSPWYPSMRLFRQPGPGEWRGLVEQVRLALADLSETDRH